MVRHEAKARLSPQGGGGAAACCACPTGESPVPVGFGAPGDKHRFDAKTWKDRYPEIQVVAPEGARAKVEETVAVDTVTPRFDDPGVQFVTVPGTRGREVALVVRTPKGTALVLNDVVGNIRDAAGFGGLLRHPAVLEAAAVGVPDKHYGQEIMACVVLRGGAEGADGTEQELREFCERHLGRFKTPKLFRFVQHLPRGPSGKVQRLKLLETVAA